ncbi:unnamed protein product [Arctogadus glacialis]
MEEYAGANFRAKGFPPLSSALSAPRARPQLRLQGGLMFGALLSARGPPGRGPPAQTPVLPASWPEVICKAVRGEMDASSQGAVQSPRGSRRGRDGPRSEGPGGGAEGAHSSLGRGLGRTPRPGTDAAAWDGRRGLGRTPRRRLGVLVGDGAGSAQGNRDVCVVASRRRFPARLLDCLRGRRRPGNAQQCPSGQSPGEGSLFRAEPTEASGRTRLLSRFKRRSCSPLPLLRRRVAAQQEVELIMTACCSGHFLLGHIADAAATWWLPGCPTTILRILYISRSVLCKFTLHKSWLKDQVTQTKSELVHVHS